MADSNELFDVDEDKDASDDDAPAAGAVSLLSADHAEVRQMFEGPGCPDGPPCSPQA